MSDSATFLSWKFNSLSHEDKFAIGLVIDTLAMARTKHPGISQDFVLQAAIVAEESGELVRASINAHKGDAPVDEVLTRASNTAAAAVRIISAKIQNLTPHQTPAEHANH